MSSICWSWSEPNKANLLEIARKLMMIQNSLPCSSKLLSLALIRLEDTVANLASSSDNTNISQKPCLDNIYDVFKWQVSNYYCQLEFKHIKRKFSMYVDVNHHWPKYTWTPIAECYGWVSTYSKNISYVDIRIRPSQFQNFGQANFFWNYLQPSNTLPFEINFNLSVGKIIWQPPWYQGQYQGSKHGAEG